MLVDLGDATFLCIVVYLLVISSFVSLNLCVLFCTLAITRYIQTLTNSHAHIQANGTLQLKIFPKCSSIRESNKQITASLHPYHSHSFEIVTIHCYSYKRNSKWWNECYHLLLAFLIYLYFCISGWLYCNCMVL